MKQLITSLIIFMALGLNACTIHKIKIDQGNVYDDQKVATLQIGMSKEQVRFILGSPLIMDPFHAQRWDYIHTLKNSKGETRSQKMTLYFNNGSLTQIDKDSQKITD